MLRLTHRGVYRRRPDLTSPACTHALHCTLGTTRVHGHDVGLFECLWCDSLLAVHAGCVLWELRKPQPALSSHLLDELRILPLSRAYTHRPLGEGS